MNQLSSSDDALPAGERFIDATLSEHARLGSSAPDTELVHRILLETVYRRPAAVAQVPRQGTVPQAWLAGAAALVAALIIAGIGLSPSTTARRDRPTEELEFTVHFLKSNPALKAPPTEVAPQLAGKTYTGRVPLAATVTEAPLPRPLATDHYELITTLGPSFEKLPASGGRRENFRITADRSVIAGDRRLYEGRVLVEHALFRIEASEVSVPSPGRTAARDQVSPLLASNVSVRQDSPRRIAHAKKLHFDPVSGAMILSGVESFETEGGKLARFAPGDQLVLTSEGFSVESPAEIKYAAPQNIKP